MQDLHTLEQRLGVHFNDYSLLLRALTHRSFLNENPDQSLEDSERLEFLGDAVLDFVVGAYLYHRYPEMHEGELTMLRAALVKTRTLAGFARRLGLGQAMRLGYGEAESGGRERAPILCACFEAVVGAIFLDQGLDAAERWVLPLIAPELESILSASAHKDAKSEFQIWAQGELGATPRYEVLTTEGPDHDKTFTVAAVVEGETWGVGKGRSKQSAAQIAAADALRRVNEIRLEAVAGNLELTEAGT
jgi:ribonuclease-3